MMFAALVVFYWLIWRERRSSARSDEPGSAR